MKPNCYCLMIHFDESYNMKNIRHYVYSDRALYAFSAIVSFGKSTSSKSSSNFSTLLLPAVRPKVISPKEKSKSKAGTKKKYLLKLPNEAQKQNYHKLLYIKAQARKSLYQDLYRFFLSELSISFFMVLWNLGPTERNRGRLPYQSPAQTSRYSKI